LGQPIVFCCLPHDNTAMEDDVQKSHSTYDRTRLAELLNTSEAQITAWIDEEGITPVSPDRPEEYGMDTLELLRTRQII
jgi:hypothetical protein